MRKLTKQEKETMIVFNEQDKTASISTYNVALLRKLEKLLQERPDECEKHNVFSDGSQYIVPKKWIKISPPKKLSDEAKAKAAERLKKARSEARAQETP